MPRPPLRRPRLPPSRAVADAVVSYHRQHRVDQCGAILWPGRLDLRGERRHRLLGPLEAHLPGLDPVLPRGYRHRRAEQVVRQQVGPYLLVHHLGRLAPQELHLHHRLDRTNVDLSIPPPLIQVAELSAIDRRVEDCGDDLETLGAVVLVAGIDGHLPHQQGVRVAAILLRAACWAAARG